MGPRHPSGAGPEPPSDLAALERWVERCTRCKLCRTRNHAVPGEGAGAAGVLVIGEAPGAEEDQVGRPFVGAAGKYLDKWLKAIELSRESTCYITNIVKCRPPGNRDPEPDEISMCRPYLDEQIRILAPRAVLTLGRFAARALTGREASMRELRGEVHRCGSIPLVATYHPSAVLRDPSLRAPVWEDLKKLKELISPEA